MKFSSLKYFSTLFVFAAALLAAWWMWNYYMQSPWTRDGKVRAEVVQITPEISGKVVRLLVTDNQYVKKGQPLLEIDQKPLTIALENASAQLAKANADLTKAQHELQRRLNLSSGVISAEDKDTYRQAASAQLAVQKAAQASVDQANWDLSQSKIVAPVSGWVTNLHLRQGDYATTGSPLFALVDSHSFYVMGYFEETKLRHIRPGLQATIKLYSDGSSLNGTVESIGRAINDQSVNSDEGLIPDIKPTVPWVRLAQRVPVRIRLDALAHHPQTLVAGTTCTIIIHQRKN